MYITPYLRSQAELLADIQADGYTTALGWSAPEVYRAVNRALTVWQKRVLSPRLYTLTNGYAAGTYEYALPNYMRPPIVAEMERHIPFNEEIDLSTTTTWQDIPALTEVDGDGGLVLRLLTEPHTKSGRLIWYAPNSRVPTGTAPVTSAEILAAATSVTLTTVVDCDDVGWIKIDQEWMSYAGVTRAATTTVLLNLERAQYGSAAATHVITSNVGWGIAVDDLGLYEQLTDQTKAYLHQQMLVNTGAHETGRHERLMQYFQSKADSYWPRYNSQRPSPRRQLDRRWLLGTI